MDFRLCVIPSKLFANLGTPFVGNFLKIFSQLYQNIENHTKCLPFQIQSQNLEYLSIRYKVLVREHSKHR